MNLKKYLFFFFPLSLIHGFHLMHQEIFFYPDSLKDLVVKNFVEKMTSVNHNNLHIENHEDHTLIKYNGAKFGYKYNATYTIYEENNNNFKIIYENNFLQNFIYIQRIDPNKINVTVDINTNVPMPKRILHSIIRNKLNSLRV